MTGLSAAEAQMAVARYFASFAWERPLPDPEMAAADFLDAL